LAEAGATVPVPAALDLSGLARYEGRAPQGILGQDFIGRYVVAIDYHARQLRLHDAETFRYAGDGTRVPVTLGNGHPHVRAELVLDDGSAVPVDGVVDVGSALALSLTKPLVERYRLRERTARQRGWAMGRGAGGPMRADVGRVAELRIGGRSIERPVTALYGDAAGVFTTGSYFEANIGADVLRRFTVFLDYRRREMILEPNADVAEPFETDMSGLDVSYDAAAKVFIVESVAAGTPADAAGIRTGDRIPSTDGHPAAATTLDAFRRSLRRDGATVTVRVRHDGRDVAVRLALRRLV
jgi:PDZ domain-containing protein